MASHITNKHSSLKNSDLIPMYDRVPSDGNAIMISKFQATKFTDQLDYQERNISSHNASIFMLEKSNKELTDLVNKQTQLIKSNTDEIASLKEEVKLANLKLIQVLNYLEKKSPSLKPSLQSSPSLEEVKLSPHSKHTRAKKRVKRFKHSKSKKVKKVKK